MVEDSEANSKEWNNGLIVSCLHIILLWWKFMDLTLSRNYFNLDTYFLKRRVLRASKEILNEKF